MNKKNISQTKNYNNFRMYLERVHKIKYSCSLARFLLDKYTNTSHPTAYIRILHEELIKYGILTKNEKMYEWRDLMQKKQILICAADKEEKKDTKANFKIAMFKFGPSIKKYIEVALADKASMYERIDTKANQSDLDLLAEKQKQEQLKLIATTLELATTKEKVADLELKVEDLADSVETLLLHALPPDTPTRREIIRKHRYEKDVCIQLLKDN